MQASLTILGCGSAKPTKSNQPSCQVLTLRDKQFMIDCGEGAQISLQRCRQPINRFSNIFISHLHGDHCFGLIGLISTLGMLGRTKTLYIHAHPDLKKLLAPMLDYFCQGMAYDVVFECFDPYKSAVIYEDRSLTVTSFPLKHRVPCAGFLFEEKQGLRHLLRDVADAYHIPIAQFNNIKQGADFVTDDGRVIENRFLTTDPTPPLRYAYCSDTAYSEKIIPHIEGVDCLYHEATYTDQYKQNARDNMHSTASQAAQIALKAKVKQLIIGHFSARIANLNELLQEAKTVFPHTILAQEGKTYQF